jgi:hypothetical protein
MRTKLGVGAGQENRQLCHGLRRYLTRMIAMGKAPVGAGPPLPSQHSADWRDAPDDGVALHFFDEEAHVVDRP